MTKRILAIILSSALLCAVPVMGESTGTSVRVSYLGPEGTYTEEVSSDSTVFEKEYLTLWADDAPAKMALTEYM